MADKRIWARRRTDSSSNVLVICDFSRILTSAHSQTFAKPAKYGFIRPAKAISSVHFARAAGCYLHGGRFGRAAVARFVQSKNQSPTDQLHLKLAPTGLRLGALLQ